ncbi:glycosyltransferase family 2 protein [Mucilaginibacter xinganensis]|uniref:Glycosyltransferase 2-like domain-containing protein n=1 Tax=Mucilaginibacter xinganensis TaxID=1234841 RepID=A0A223P498_9SPHI|nr:glycosyltransferase family 2 protein [Mucilaginibacter xinganensis]ASU36794.1 hypothetical protein MuYL_4911 [Mucilaginibacter xinganensis]
MKEGVSVIVCCYNSSLRIVKTLEYLAAQTIKNIGCEIVLVDNASADDTGTVAASIWAGLQPNGIAFTIVSEPKPGLSNARLKGILAATYEYLVFCDDDNWLDENYIQNVYRLFKEEPEVGIIGGFGTAVFENAQQKPFWFDTFHQSYAVGLEPGETAMVDTVYGAGIAIRKSVLENVTQKYPMFLDDRKEKELSAGGDSELCGRVRLSGYKILYTPLLTFRHYITSTRLTWAYLKKLHIGFAKSHLVLNLYNEALTSTSQQLPSLYWLKKALYYWGIYLKYWPRHYLAYRTTEGTNEEIHHITWKNIGLNYFAYNFKTSQIYSKVVDLKKNSDV